MSTKNRSVPDQEASTRPSVNQPNAAAAPMGTPQKPRPQEVKQDRASETGKSADGDTEQRTISEVIDDSMHSRDQPLGKQAPSSPFALVAWSYLLILFLFLAVVLGIYFLMF